MMSAKVKFFSVVFALMVVGIHVSTNVCPHNSFKWWWEQIGPYGVFLAAVPFFFVCSGFFLGKHCEETGWWLRACSARVWSLLVPYLIWNILFAVLKISSLIISNIVNGREVFSCMPSAFSFVMRVVGVFPFDHPLLYPLWYVRSLIFFVLLSPLLVKLIRLGGAVFVVMLYFVALGCAVFIPSGRSFSFVFKWFSVSGLLWFCCGLFFSQSRIKLGCQSRCFAVVSLFSGLLILALKAYLNLRCGWRNDQLLMLVYIPLILAGMWILSPVVRLPDYLSRLAFPIYVLHVPVLFVGRMLFLRYNDNWCFWYVFAIAGTVVGSWIMKRCFPRFADVAFGGRF